MCVAVSMEPGTQLSLDEVTRMTNANADGMGFAWAEEGVVQWYKSVNYNPEYVTKLINERIGHFRLVHFRLATVGGVRADLCHPFEVGPLANSDHKGYGSKVLIHNGHWNRWTDVYDLMKGVNALPDYGPWSDSRFMALLASENLEWLDTVGGRVAVMDGEGNTQFWGDWSKLRDGILVSNKIWESHTYNYKKHGRGANQHWQGQPWGRTEEEWNEWYNHQEALKAEEAAAKEKASEQKGASKGTEGKEEGKEGKATKDVVSEPLQRAVRAFGSAQGGAAGGHKDGGGEGGHLLHEGSNGRGAGDGNAKVDLIPWQNPASHKWYAVNPKTIGTRGGTGVMEISAEDAVKLMVKAAASSATEGDAEGDQGKGPDKGGSSRE